MPEIQIFTLKAFLGAGRGEVFIFYSLTCGLEELHFRFSLHILLGKCKQKTPPKPTEKVL